MGISIEVNTLLMSESPEFRKARPYQDIGERIAEARRVLARARSRRIPQRAVAEAVGVAEGTVTAWEIGKQKPEGANLIRLAEFLCVTPTYILTGADEWVDSVDEPTSQQPPRDQLDLDLFRDIDRIVRYVEGVGPPGKSKALKRDILNGLRIAITAREPLPQWWKDLYEKVENDEL